MMTIMSKILKVGKPKVENNWITLVKKAYKYSKNRNYWESIELAEKALELNPRASEAHRLIGNAYEMLGLKCEEEGRYEKSIQYRNKATEEWNRAIEINPRIKIPGYHSHIYGNNK